MWALCNRLSINQTNMYYSVFGVHCVSWREIPVKELIYVDKEGRSNEDVPCLQP